MPYFFLVLGALFGFLGVAAGAFGAHLLKSRLVPESFDVFEVAVRYQMYHALALVMVGMILFILPSSWFVAAGWLFVIGVIIFSGSLYLLVLTETRTWGAITPIGGLFLLGGWLIFLLGGVFVRLAS